MHKFLIIALALIVGTFFAGCSNRVNVSSQQSPTSTIQESNLPASTGNIDGDFEEIDASLDSMNTDADFPSVSEAELTAQ